MDYRPKEENGVKGMFQGIIHADVAAREPLCTARH